MKCKKHDWDWDISDPTGCPICHGERLAEERIVKWVDDHRSYLSLDDESGWYRDHFDSESLVAFIKGTA